MINNITSPIYSPLKENDFNLANGVVEINLVEEKIPTKIPTIDLYIVSNIDSPDETSAIQLGIQRALNSEITVITTISQLFCIEDKDKKTIKDKVRSITDILEKDKYFIYILKEKEILLFYPKKLSESLEEVGFQTKILERVTLRELLLLPRQENASEIEDLLAIFHPTKHVGRRIILDGHGDDESIGGLDLSNYQLLLSFFDQTGADLFADASCYSGNIPTLYQCYRENKKIKYPRFPIIALSSGPFLTTNDNINFNNFFTHIDAALKGVASIRNPHFSLALQTGEKKEFYNLAKILFPSHRSSPVGFQPINEDDAILTITYNRLKRYMVQKKSEIEVIKKTEVRIFPLIIETSLLINGITFLHSDVPGNSHHYIDKIILKDIKLYSFFEYNAQLQYSYQNSSRKAYFISEIQGKDKTYNKVVLFFDKTTAKCYFKSSRWVYNPEKDRVAKHYLKNALDTVEVRQIPSETKPLANAVRVSCGGQESDNDFNRHLQEYFFN